MIKSAVTISLVPEARGGPFVFWDDLEVACRKAAELGFDAVEVFAPSADAIASQALGRLLKEHGLHLAAAGTGAGWVLHRLSLTDPDGAVRRRAREFINDFVDAAGALGAPAIVGSMQGRYGGLSPEAGFVQLRDALHDLGDAALPHGVPLLFEPLNRYETNVANHLCVGVGLIESAAGANVKLLADLFHMNIEERDIAGSIRANGSYIGHVHLADSNRWAAGAGHTDFVPIAAALREIGYSGYVSAEVLPFPDPDAAAEITIDTFRKFFR